MAAAALEEARAEGDEEAKGVEGQDHEVREEDRGSLAAGNAVDAPPAAEAWGAGRAQGPCEEARAAEVDGGRS